MEYLLPFLGLFISLLTLAVVWARPRPSTVWVVAVAYAMLVGWGSTNDTITVDALLLALVAGSVVAFLGFGVVAVRDAQKAKSGWKRGLLRLWLVLIPVTWIGGAVLMLGDFEYAPREFQTRQGTCRYYYDEAAEPYAPEMDSPTYRRPDCMTDDAAYRTALLNQTGAIERFRSELARNVVLLFLLPIVLGLCVAALMSLIRWIVAGFAPMKMDSVSQ